MGRLLFVLVFALSAAATHAQISEKVLIQGGKIIPVVGDVIEKGNILIENGKITAIGADVKPPFDATVIDATGKIILPGVVEPFTVSGTDRPNETMDQGSFLHVSDAIDPSDPYFEDSLRAGITTINVGQADNAVITGVSRIVRPVGISVDEMTVRGDCGLKVVMSQKSGYDRGAQMASLRQIFSELDRYLERRAEELYEADLKKKGEELTVGPAEARKLGKDLVTLAKLDDAHRNLVRLRKGHLMAFVVAPAAMDLAPGLKFATDQGYLGQSSLIVGTEAIKTARTLRRSGRPVILPSTAFVYSKTNRDTLEVEETFVPAALADARVAFGVSGVGNPWYTAARLVRNGVSRKAAMESITINSARAIGMADTVGSLEVGKHGNVVIMSGDPLEFTSWVDEVWIEGRRTYEKHKDLRVRDLLQGAYDTKRRVEEKKKAEEAKKKKPEAPKKPGSGDKKAPADAGKKVDGKPAPSKPKAGDAEKKSGEKKSDEKKN